MSTPSLIQALADSEVGHDVTIRLAGRDPKRLQAVARAARLLAPDICIQTFEKGNWAAALDGAAIVLVQTRIGGQRGRALDETLAMRCNVPADEGLGAGGLCCAARSWPEMRMILELVHRRAPDALTLLLSSPAGLLIRLAAYEWPQWRIYGVCELPYTTLLQVCARLGYSFPQVDFAYTGVNHLGFIHSISASGYNLVTDYCRQEGFPLASVVRRCHAIPLKYLRFHFERASVVREQAGQQPRGAALAALEEVLMGEFAHGTVFQVGSALRLRPAPWYRHAVVPLIVARVGMGSGYPFFLSTIEPDGTVREKLFSVSPTKIEARPERAAPDEVGEVTSKFVAYENLAAQAVRSREVAALRNAWSTHPWADPATVNMCASEIWNRVEAAQTDVEKGLAPCLN